MAGGLSRKQKDNARASYLAKQAYLDSLYPKVTPEKFYRDLFPEGSFRSDASGSEDGLCCGIFSFRGEKDTLKLMKQKANQKIVDASDLPTMMKYFGAILMGSNEDKDLQKKYDSLDYHFSAGAYKKPGKPIQSDWVLHDLVHDDLSELKMAYGKREARMAPIGYFGDKFTTRNAHMLFAITLDLDGVGMEQLKNLIHGFVSRDLTKDKGYVIPTYLVNSGTGFHLYYILDEPIPLYDYVKNPITDLKEKLIDQIWNSFTSKIKDHKDAQPWHEDFRMVGSLSKLGTGYPVVAYKTGSLVSLETLNNELYSGDRIKLPLTEYRPKGRTGKTLEECKELYPNWYNRVIERKGTKQTRKSFTMHRGVYDSWLERIKKGKKVGTRYHCISMLFAAAIKCGIPYDEVYADALDLLADFNALACTKTERFTKYDIDCASLYYKDCFRNVSLNSIEQKTEIKLPRNKRNGRPRFTEDDGKGNKRVGHMEYLNKGMDMDFFKNTHFNSDTGREAGLKGTKEQIIREYLQEHPEAKKCEVIQYTKLSKNTVYKWYKIIKDEGSKENEEC